MAYLDYRIERFRTEAVPPTQRLSFWNQVVMQTFGGISVDAEGRGFAAQLNRRHFGSLLLANVDSAPARILGAPQPELDDEYCYVLLNQAGHSVAHQGRQSVALGPGELTLLRAKEPYRIEFSRPNRMSVLSLPVPTAHVDLDSHLLVRHSLEQGALLAAFIRRLETLDANPASGSSHMRLAQDLMALTWPRQPQQRRASAQVWEQRILTLLERNLADSTLDAKGIGNELGISARYVQMVFARRGETLSSYLQERRLTLASYLLRSHPAMSITDIAYASGFCDLSHFCHVFQRRFGTSARRWRSGSEG